MTLSTARRWSLATLVLANCGGSHATSTAPATPSAAPPSTHTAGAASTQPSAAKPAVPAKPSAASEEAVPDPVVRVSFEPLVNGVRRGARFLLAAHFHITPGYWISWKSNGEHGQRTRVTFRAPPGFVVGAARFPTPVRYTIPGGFVGYGYERETAVFVEVKAPGSLRAKDVNRFDVEASWVACKKRCSTEQTNAYVELDTVSRNANDKDAQAALAPFLAQLPVPLSKLKKSEQVWESAAPGATLIVKLPKAAPRDFFPEGGADPAPRSPTFGDGEIRFLYDVAPTAGSQPLRGVIVASVDGKERAFELEATVPEDDEHAKAAR